MYLIDKISLSLMNQYPKKQLGQNFLIDKNIITKIIHLIEPEVEDVILEIGPGKGALTRYLAQMAKSLIAVEKDKGLIYDLNKDIPDAQFILMDALTFPWHRANGYFTKIVGNLPYNIATTLIFDIVAHFSRGKLMVFMVQKEVAEKICAKPGDKKFGVLSAWIQTFCDVKADIIIKPTCFYPRPKVLSQVILLIPKKIELNKNTQEKLKKTIKTCFNNPRKQLKTILKNRWNSDLDDFFKKNKIREDARPNMLTPEQYLQLAETIYKK